MDGIYTSGRAPRNGAIREREDTRTEPEYKAGELIEGIVTAIGDRISINFSGKEFHFPKEAVPSAKEGEKRTYQIMEASGAAFVLKEIGKKDSENGPGKMLFTTVDAGIQVMAQNFGNVAMFEPEDDGMDKLSDRVTERDCEELEEEGMTLEKYQLERLERLLERMKLQSLLKQAGLEGQLEKKQEGREAIARMAKENAVRKMAHDGVAAHIAEQLLASNLPVTERNVSQIADAMRWAEEAKAMTEASFSYLIRQRLTPTIEHCYKAAHAGATLRHGVSDEVMREMEPQIRNILRQAGELFASRAGQTDTDATWAQTGAQTETNTTLQAVSQQTTSQQAAWQPSMEDARWLLEQELLLTPENLLAKHELELLVEDFGTEDLSREAILRGTVESLYQGREPKQTNLSLLRQKEEQRLSMTERAANRMQRLGVEVDVEAIRERIEALKKEEASYYRSQLQEYQKTQTDGSTAPVETSLFDRTLEAAERIRNADVTLLGESFPTRRTQTLQSLSELAIRLQARGALQSTASGEALGGAQPGAMQQAAMQQAATQQAPMQQAATQAAKSYEPLMTAPRRDMGDSIQKAFRNVDSQLDALGLELSEANRRAVRILGYNRTELTTENINEMKYYDAKVQHLMLTLRPQVTVELIRNGINPLDITIDELSLAADEISRALGTQPEERFSEHLVKLDRKRELSAEERDSYIGIYRMLYRIEKTDGAAVGALIKSGRELTLGNLLTESRGVQRRGMDISVDEQFGEAERVRAGRSIDEQVAAAYHTEKLREAEVKLTPDRLHRIAKKNELAELTPERLSELLAEEPEGDSDREYRSEQLERFRALATDCTAEKRFLERFDIENSPQQLQAAKLLLQGVNPYRRLRSMAAGAKRVTSQSAEASELLNSGDDTGAAETLSNALSQTADGVSVEELVSAMDGKEAMQTLGERIRGTAAELMDALYTAAELKKEQAGSLKELFSMHGLTHRLWQKECYEIPIADENGITGLRLTVVHGKEQTGSFRMLFRTAENGNEISKRNGTEASEGTIIKVDGVYKKDGLELRITSEDARINERMKEEAPRLQARLEQAGIPCGGIFCSRARLTAEAMLLPTAPEESGAAEEAENETTEVKTSVLYTAAKETILHIRSLLKKQSGAAE